MRIRCAVTLAIAAALVAPGNVSAADSNNGSSIDVSAIHARSLSCNENG